MIEKLIIINNELEVLELDTLLLFLLHVGVEN
jgi:hypothetical protein